MTPAFSLRSDKMRLLLVAFVLAIVIASCVAQPQGQAKAAAASLNRHLDLGISSAYDRTCKFHVFCRTALWEDNAEGQGNSLKLFLGLVLRRIPNLEVLLT